MIIDIFLNLLAFVGIVVLTMIIIVAIGLVMRTIRAIAIDRRYKKLTPEEKAEMRRVKK